MRIAFFAPHKHIDHNVPSGDLMIGRSLYNFLRNQGHELYIASKMRLWHITTNPGRWTGAFIEYRKTLKKVSDFNPDCWLTYHSYYKSPDLFGPHISELLGIPYFIYQGVFATKHRRKFSTWPGYMANKYALLTAKHVFANKKIDFCNLSRIIIPEKLSRTRPGINTEEFKFCEISREILRKQLDLSGKVCVLSTAMLREDVKAESISQLINAFASVSPHAPEATLLIVGDGEARARLETLANQAAPGKIHFLGRIERSELYKYYSMADLFAYPGINEALGMVYLESQSAGLPVIAYSTRGPSETVIQGKTGLLSPERDIQALADNILNLIKNSEQRKLMSMAAPKHVKQLFDLNTNLLEVESQLMKDTYGR